MAAIYGVFMLGAGEIDGAMREVLDGKRKRKRKREKEKEREENMYKFARLVRGATAQRAANHVAEEAKCINIQCQLMRALSAAGLD